MKERRKSRGAARWGYAVANQAETSITLTNAPDDREGAVITEGLRAYNEAQAGVSDSRALAILVRNPETQNVVGEPVGPHLTWTLESGKVFSAGEFAA